MFEQFFQTASTIARHKAGPYAAERERYLKRFADEGYRFGYLKQLAGMLFRIVHELWDYPGPKISAEQIRTATQRATRRYCGFYKIQNNREFNKRFAREAKHWLRFLGRSQESAIKPITFADKLDGFAVWMQRERGLSPATIEKRCWYIASFLRWFGGKGIPSLLSVWLTLTHTKLLVKTEDCRASR